MIPLLLALAIGFAPAQPSAVTIVRPAAAPGPLDNPLKGWCDYTGHPPSQPYSMVFQYVSWKELEPVEGRFAFAEWERRTWNGPVAAGKRIVFRVYLDYPGRPSGVPDWLVAKGVKLTPHSEYGGGLSPDYNDPRLVSALERLIRALGRRYDGNPRIAFVEMGMLGVWGEWHTFPRVELFAMPATQQRILDAAHRAFHKTLVMTRYPDAYAGAAQWLGYFDDSFPGDTDGPERWKFLSRMRRSGRTAIWTRAPIGGEMEPRKAAELLGAAFPETLRRLEAGHFTWIGPYNPSFEETRDPEFMERSREMVRRMGYEFTLTEIRVRTEVVRGQRLNVNVIGVNNGVAPFYYRWPVEFALLDANNAPVEIFRLPVDIRTWLPGPFTFEAHPHIHAPPGTYTLAIGVRDPWTHRPGIAFANEVERRNCWALLTEIRVSARETQALSLRGSNR